MQKHTYVSGAKSMKKRLFLIGPDRCGKSDMIHKTLGNQIRRAGGFVTVRELDADGNIQSFDLKAADGSGQRSRFLEFVNGQPMTRLEVFSQTGTRLLRQAQSRPFAVLDELGGVELLDDGFVRALVKLLRGNTPCIGVMKGSGPAGKVVGVMGLNLRYELARRALFDYLTRDPDTQVIQTTGKDDAEVRAMVETWAAEYVKE